MKKLTDLKNKLVSALSSNNESTSIQSNIAQKISTFDIISTNSMSSSLYDKFLLSADGIEDVEKLRKCKVLTFLSTTNFEVIISNIARLNHQQCPNLFIFAVTLDDLTEAKVENFQTFLLKFSESRPLILQIKDQKQNSSKIYLKLEETYFNEINLSNQNDQNFEDFSSFLRLFLTSKITNFEQLMLKKLPKIKDSIHIIRFLRTLKMSKNFFKKLVIKCAAEGSKLDLLAAIDDSFESEGRILSCEVENWIKFKITTNRKKEKSDKSDEIQDQSVLLTAVSSANFEVVDYLISHCGHLIQQLPFDHQIHVSTSVFVSKQYDILCDLIELCDFPFPENFNPELTENEKLNKIVEERKKFIEMIESKELNKEELSKFIHNHRHLNIIYTFDNQSLLLHALINGLYKAYFYLKSLGYESTEFDDINEILNDDELKEAKKFEIEQRKENVQKSILNNKNPIYLLITRSSIHNRKTRSEDEKKYRKLIEKWYEDIYNSRHGSMLLRVASMCSKLRIIFDFESNSVENVSLQSKYTEGSMYPRSKWIFVGAKLEPNREQKIKGVLAHELCHYVMKLTYENNEKPYFRHDRGRRLTIDSIVTFFDKWSGTKKNHNDGCDGIISGVYKLYNQPDWIAELIVRVPQIFAQYDNDPEKMELIEIDYKMLFKYYEEAVIPDMQKLDLEGREDVRKLNKKLELLPIVSDLNYKFSESMHVELMVTNNIHISKVNIPTLLYAEINEFICDEYGILFDCQNIFVDLTKLKIEENYNHFKEILSKNENINVFLDCTTDIEIELDKILLNNNAKFVFIFTNQSLYDKTKACIEKLTSKLVYQSIKEYTWKRLHFDSQKKILDTQVNFQNKNLKLFDILWNKKKKPSAVDEIKIINDFDEIIDDELLTLLTNNTNISIQTNFTNQKIDEDFEIFFQDRKFIKKVMSKISAEISQKDLFSSTKNQQFVLISDIAGTGKSWALKKAAKIIRDNNPTKWVTYVNLQQHIKAFNAQKKNELNFLNFMIERVFDFDKEFISKLFKYLYNNGHVCILLDGFDEISPNYAEVVKKLIDSFKKNGKNQLWIATRDFFEVDLQKHLKLDTSYKLVDFKDEDIINLIIRNCVMADLRFNKVKIEDNFDMQVRSHPKYQTYLTAAIKIYQKITTWTLKSIGLPQLCKMIGDVLIEFEDSIDMLTEFTLYDKFIDHLFKIWYSEKGELGEQRKIVGCGILNKKTEDGDEFIFPHETYREFFAASFVIRILKKKPRKVNTDVLKYLIKFCSHSTFGVIQMFLHQGFENINALPKNNLIIIKTNVPKLLEINIYQYIQREFKNVNNVKNIIVIRDDMLNDYICENFDDNFLNNSNLEAVVKPSRDFSEELKDLTVNGAVAIIVIVTDEHRGRQIREVLQEFKFQLTYNQIMYNWNDLTDGSQKMLLQDEFSIDNHTNAKLYELVTGRELSTFGEDLTDFSEVIDDQIVNIIANKSMINVSKNLKYDMEFRPFQLLYQPRRFVKITNCMSNLDGKADQEPQNSTKNTKLLQDQLILDVEMKPFVLISDIAGTGKTMAAQEITNILRHRYPYKWITYINLSFSISDYFVYHQAAPEFSTFCIEKLFKSKSQLKVQKCFLNRYNSGNAIFILDGFDEVAHESVGSYQNKQNFLQIYIDSIKSFKHNKGNQLWIVTKDNFQEKLFQELKINVAYKMDDYSETDGKDLIVKYQILKNIKAINDLDLENEFQKMIKNKCNIENYQKRANKLIEKISNIENTQLTCVIFSILAKNFDIIFDKKEFEIFTNLVVSHYKLWINFKSEVWKDPDIGSNAHQEKFWKIHHFHAINIMFPEYISFLFPNYDGSEWWDHILILCGFLNKKNGKFYFLNKTFCSFFVADYLHKNLIVSQTQKKHSGKTKQDKVETNSKLDNPKMKILWKIIENQEYKPIQIFLKDVIDFSTLLKLKPQIDEFIKKYKKFNNFSEYVPKDLESLINFVTDIQNGGIDN